MLTTRQCIEQLELEASAQDSRYQVNTALGLRIATEFLKTWHQDCVLSRGGDDTIKPRFWWQMSHDGLRNFE